MSEMRSLLNHLCAWVESAISAQRELGRLVDAQQAAVRTHQPDAVENATRAIEEALRSAPARDARRAKLFEGLARHFGVAAGALTLTSIATRCGADADDLSRLALELRTAVGDLARSQQQVAALIATHRRVTRDVLVHLLADEHGRNPLEDAGVLLDAEA